MVLRIMTDVNVMHMFQMVFVASTSFLVNQSNASKRTCEYIQGRTNATSAISVSVKNTRVKRNAVFSFSKVHF